MPALHPRFDLRPEFVGAVRQSGWSFTHLSQLVGWRIENLGQVINNARIVATPANLDRLRLLATIIGFEGELFERPQTVEAP